MMSQPDRLRPQAILSVVCFALLIGVVYRYQRASSEKKQNVARITYYSNQWSSASEKVREQTAVNLAIERQYSTRAEELKSYSNSLIAVSADLEQTHHAAQTAADATKDQVARQDGRIAQLESERDSMNKTLGEMSGSISNLETQISQTEQKLQASTADRIVLLAELKRLQAEKADLEQRFHNLAVLRDQIHHIRDELSISRRLAWIRRGLLGNLKGAEVLQAGFADASPAQAKFNLDVEVRRDQAAKVVANENQ